MDCKEEKVHECPHDKEQRPTEQSTSEEDIGRTVEYMALLRTRFQIKKFNMSLKRKKSSQRNSIFLGAERSKNRKESGLLGGGKPPKSTGKTACLSKGRLLVEMAKKTNSKGKNSDKIGPASSWDEMNLRGEALIPVDDQIEAQEEPVITISEGELKRARVNAGLPPDIGVWRWSSL